MQEVDESVEFAEKVLKLKPTSFEAYYARAKALKDLRCVLTMLKSIYVYNVLCFCK